LNTSPPSGASEAAAWEITERVGLPECRHTLAQAVIYMAAAPKSNASAKAIWAASADVREGRTIPVPKHLRDTHYRGAAALGHGEGYQYPHDAPGGHVDQEYLGVDRVYYAPTDRGFEADIRDRLHPFKGPRRIADKDGDHGEATEDR